MNNLVFTHQRAQSMRHCLKAALARLRIHTLLQHFPHLWFAESTLMLLRQILFSAEYRGEKGCHISSEAAQALLLAQQIEVDLGQMCMSKGRVCWYIARRQA
jgi:hypothetical protein